MPTLQLALLSDFQLVYDDESISGLVMVRAQALLAYLVLHAGESPSRRAIAAAFWPDSTEGQARTNLRQLLYHLRRALPDAERFLDGEGDVLAWRADAPATTDVAAFTRALARATAAERDGEPQAALVALEEAVGWYRGDLLPQCDDDWIVPERDRLRRNYLAALERLLAHCEERRDYARAIRHGERLLAEEPLREATYRDLLRCHALHGDRAAALRLYRRCVTLLRDELGVAPEAATAAVYERLLQADEGPRTERGAASVPPLVGRWREWAALRDNWRDAAIGPGRLVVLAGEAGIGKTRLAEELLAWAEGQGIATARAHCYAAEGRLAYAPVAEWLRAGSLRAGWRRLDPAWLAELGRVLPEARRASEPSPADDALDEAARRQRLFEALSRALLATRRPLLLLLDDLQWCDGETLAWLRYLLRRAPGPPLLIVATLRSEESGDEHPATPLLRDLDRAGQLVTLPLEPLDAADTATLAAQIVGRALTTTQAAQLFQETEGYPLFAVERARIGLATASHDGTTGAQAAAPPAVRAVLAARLAQLSPGARALAELAATVGRDFTAEVLTLASGTPEADLARDLDELWQRRIVRAQRGTAYDFSHDKLREAAYAGLGPAQRRLLHRHVARALTTLHDGALDRISGQLAAHYEQAGMTLEAVTTYGQAAEAAQHLFANAEAIDHFRRALALLATLPETPERAERELSLQVRLAASLTAQSVFGAPGVAAAYTRARDLCLQLEQPLTAPVLHGLASTTQMQCKMLEARDYAQHLLNLAEAKAEPVLLVEAHYLVGANASWRGEYRTAQRHIARSLDLYNLRHRPAHLSLYARDPQVIGTSRLAWLHFQLGYLDSAVHECRGILEQARLLAHPFSHIFVLAPMVHIHAERGEVTLVRQYALEMQIVASKPGEWSYWVAYVDVILGWAEVETGDPEHGLALLRRGLVAFEALQIANGFVTFNRTLILAYQRLGRIDEALTIIDAILRFIEKTEQRDLEADIRRLQAALLLASGANLDLVEQHFRAALLVARRQGTKLFEIRILVGLCDLEQRRGRAGEAHQELQRLYAWFTEGFETPDLRAARRILATLDAPVTGLSHAKERL